MNEALIKILIDAADQLALAATSCESVKHVENPDGPTLLSCSTPARTHCAIWHRG
jgi:hypothetical protein